jgi:outer membrane immunogenic protein
MFKATVSTAAATLFLIGAADAADLAVRPYTKAPVMTEAVFNWTGWYIGGNVGYGWGRERGELTGTQNVSVFRTAGPTLISSVNTPFTAISSGSNADGIIGGAQVGYNWQNSNWLFGLETDIQGSDQHSNSSFCLLAGCPVGAVISGANYKLDWFGTVRGRVGFLPTQKVLLYATGGLAYGQISADALAVPFGWGDTRVGWTVGAGAEVAIDRNWSVKFEYLYMDLGSFGGSSSATVVTNALNTPAPAFNTVTTTSITGSNTRFTDNIVRVGINYRFGGPIY